MRTIWRVLMRTVFWSYERGTWPYDVAVILIVAFVLLSPRSWFNDRPAIGPPAPAATAMVQLRADSAGEGIEVYRVDARLVAGNESVPEPQLEYTLHEAVRQNVQQLKQKKFKIVRIDTVPGAGGAIAYYDVSIRP
jgi:hypothetical protein